MFIENSTHRSEHQGCIEVITGCMFSGKTEELIRRLKRAIIAHQKVGIFKSAYDKRYSEVNIVSHNANARQWTGCESYQPPAAGSTDILTTRTF